MKKKVSPIMKTILPSIVVAGSVVLLKTDKTYAGESVNDAKDVIQSDIWRGSASINQSVSCHSNCHSSCHGSCGRKGW